MTFRFKDGSIEDETTVVCQHRTFRLLSDRVLQKGPAFKLPMETPIDAMSGRVTVRYRGDDGKEKVVTEKLDLPSDLSNGLLLTLFKNVQSIYRERQFPMSPRHQNRESSTREQLTKERKRSRLESPNTKPSITM